MEAEKTLRPKLQVEVLPFTISSSNKMQLIIKISADRFLLGGKRFRPQITTNMLLKKGQTGVIPIHQKKIKEKVLIFVRAYSFW